MKLQPSLCRLCDVLDSTSVHRNALPGFTEVLRWPREALHIFFDPARLAGFQECIYSKSEELIEYVPEALKNLLLVMASRGILTEQWRVRVCHMVSCLGRSG